ncbi:MAG: replicative DNA helicase [Christensenellaceae bacterium]|jgi:replicative DNA helicase|nr:replicative DNA helicase [Christensenellaceae bacterium]
MGNQMPHNLTAEQSAIACVLLDNNCLSGFLRLAKENFYSPAHQIIYEAISSLASKNVAVDFITLTERLTSTNKLDSIGGMNYLNILTDIVPNAANFKHYVQIIKRNSTLRRLVGAGTEIIKESTSTDDEQNALKVAEKLVYDIGREDERKQITPLSAELPGVLETLDLVAHDPSALRGLKTGYYALDDITNGLQKSDLIIVAARAGGGKTALGLNIILNCALRSKAKCAIFSLEMSKQQLTTRALCSVARVSMKKAVRGELSATEWTKVWNANKKLAAANIYIDDSSGITADEIVRKCQRLQREEGLDLVMVDYLGLIASPPTTKFENRQTAVAASSRAMKIMAKDLDIPVLLLSQLNREIDARKAHDATAKPVLSDLRESGAIEQDADIVMFIHKPKDESQSDISEDEDTGITKDCDAEIIIAKHRNGETGKFKLHWHGEYTTFENISGAGRTAQRNGTNDGTTTQNGNGTNGVAPGHTENRANPSPVIAPQMPELVPIQDTTTDDVF